MIKFNILVQLNLKLKLKIVVMIKLNTFIITIIGHGEKLIIKI